MATVNDIPELVALKYQIPEGKYQAARYSKTRTRQDLEQDEPSPHKQQEQQQQQQQQQPQPQSQRIQQPGGSELSTVSHSGGSSSPELLPPLKSFSRPRSALVSSQHIVAPSPIASAQTFGPPLCLPRIAPPIPSRPDPQWVLKNYVAASPDVCQMQNGGFSGSDPSKNMAPLVYMRRSPYQRRHPLDNDALRALDACQL